MVVPPLYFFGLTPFFIASEYAPQAATSLLLH